MTLSKHDFESIADAINGQQGTLTPDQRAAVGYVVNALATDFADRNPRFDANTFRAACGFPELQEGPRLIGKDVRGVWWVSDGADEYGFSTKAAARDWLTRVAIPAWDASNISPWCRCADAEPIPYESDGPIGHGFDCGRCGKLLQVG